MPTPKLRRSCAPAAATAVILSNLLVGSAAVAQQTATTLDFRNAPFDAVVQAVADGTGQRFIVDARIQSPLTILSAGPLSTEAVWQAFNAMLEIHGLEARRVGRDLRITPTQPTSAASMSSAARVIATSVGSPKQLSADSIAAEPAFANGAQRGLRVTPGAAAAEFDRLGLDHGDVLLAVNGTALDDPGSSKQVLDAALQTPGDVTVKVERAGRVQELVLYTARR